MVIRSPDRSIGGASTSASQPGLVADRREVLIGIVDSIGRQLQGLRVGVFAMVLTALSLSFADAAHSARQALVQSAGRR